MTGKLATVHTTPLEFINSSIFSQSQGPSGFITKSDLIQYQFEDIIPTVIKSNLSLLELDDERTYDDPCDLMEDWSSSPPRIPRSRSWLCCPNSMTKANNTLPKPKRRNSCQYSSLITEAPKLKTQNNVKFDISNIIW